MAIRTVVTMGYGNGTFSGSVSLLPTLGYAIGAAPVANPSSGEYLGSINRVVKFGCGRIEKYQRIIRITEHDN